MWLDNIGFGIFQNLIDLIKFYGQVYNNFIIVLLIGGQFGELN
jgi:hypothetical protein